MKVELIEQIIHLPIAERVEIIERISRSVREDLRADEVKESSLERRKAAVERLRGVAKMENLPMTKEEIREDYYSKSANGNADVPVFTIKALSLEPRTEFDFDNIAELIEQVEGDFYR